MDQVETYISKALNKHLNAMTPTIGISWENTNYEATNGVGYLETWLKPIPTTAITLGSNYWEEFSGIFQITCVYPSGRGANDCKTKAAAVSSYFKRGTLCTYSSVSLKIVQSWVDTASYSNDGSWYKIPVKVKYICYASN
ncbi:MAG: phage tail terminator-like protein [Thermodesulfobacteriota bacterium]